MPIAEKLDDADSQDDVSLQNEQLDNWSLKVQQIKEEKPDCAISRVLRDAYETCQIPLELDVLIEGMRMDVNGPVVAPNWDDLYQYCRKVAVSVRLLSLPLFGRIDEGKRTCP